MSLKYYFCTMLNRIQTVKIHWSKPILFDNRWNSQNFNEEIGLYIISRRYIRNGFYHEKYIYVGETINTFEIRCNQHLDKWSSWLNPIGQKYIRFGRIDHIPTIVDNIKHFVWTIESATIQAIINLPNVELLNIKQINSYTIWYDLLIENKGYRGVLPIYINTRDYYK